MNIHQITEQFEKDVEVALVGFPDTVETDTAQLEITLALLKAISEFQTEQMAHNERIIARSFAESGDLDSVEFKKTAPNACQVVARLKGFIE
jgi:hypothetical protein